MGEVVSIAKKRKEKASEDNREKIVTLAEEVTYALENEDLDMWLEKQTEYLKTAYEIFPFPNIVVPYAYKGYFYSFLISGEMINDSAVPLNMVLANRVGKFRKGIDETRFT